MGQSPTGSRRVNMIHLSSNWSLLLLSIASCLVIQDVLTKSDARYSYSGYRSKYSPGYYGRIRTYHGPGSHHSPGHRYRKYGYKLVSGPQLGTKTSPPALELMEMDKTVTTLNRNLNFNINENTVAPSVTKPKQRKFPKRIPEPLSILDNPVKKAQPPPPSPEPPATRPSPILPSLDPIFQELPPALAPVIPQAVPAVPGLPVLSDNSVSDAAPSISRMS